MTEARRPTRSEELLFERERKGVRTLTIVRGSFVLMVVATVWIVGVNLFEKLATTAIAALVLVAIGISLFLLARRTAMGMVGLAGCVIDIAVLSVLPVIWYLSVGGGDVPPAYMLKTQITVVTFGTPDPSDDDAERSVRAGLAMYTALAELNGERKRRNLANVRHGIGIHFGPVIVGRTSGL